MTNTRKETVDNFSEKELVKMVKDNLDMLGIPYEDGPGGFGGVFFITPDVFREGA